MERPTGAVAWAITKENQVVSATEKPKRLTRRRVLLGALGLSVTALLAVNGFFAWAWTTAKPVTAEDFWALISALANIALLGVAMRGLRSLVLTRKGMLTQATRDARQNAVQRCEEFAAEVIPLNIPVLTAFAAYQVPTFVKDAGDVQFDPDNAADVGRAAEWIKKLPAGTFSHSLAFLNRLEAWSMYFTNQLADPNVAYGPCAPFFCSTVVQHYPVLLHQRNSDASSGKYPNIVALFKHWISSMDEEKLLKQVEAFQKKGSPSSKLPNPLGTELDE